MAKFSGQIHKGDSHKCPDRQSPPLKFSGAGSSCVPQEDEVLFGRKGFFGFALGGTSTSLILGAPGSAVRKFTKRVGPGDIPEPTLEEILIIKIVMIIRGLTHWRCSYIYKHTATIYIIFYTFSLQVTPLFEFLGIKHIPVGRHRSAWEFSIGDLITKPLELHSSARAQPPRCANAPHMPDDTVGGVQVGGAQGRVPRVACTSTDHPNLLERVCLECALVGA